MESRAPDSGLTNRKIFQINNHPSPTASLEFIFYTVRNFPLKILTSRDFMYFIYVIFFTVQPCGYALKLWWGRIPEINFIFKKKSANVGSWIANRHGGIILWWDIWCVIASLTPDTTTSGMKCRNGAVLPEWLMCGGATLTHHVIRKSVRLTMGVCRFEAVEFMTTDDVLIYCYCY